MITNSAMNDHKASFRRPPERSTKRQPDHRIGQEKTHADAPMTATDHPTDFADSTISPSQYVVPLPDYYPPSSKPHRPKRPRSRD